VAAGGRLVVDKQKVKEHAPYKGVYVVCVRPPGALPLEWTPVYLGKGAVVGDRCAQYLDNHRGQFLGDSCVIKCRAYEELAAGGFDVGIL
jgi:hypothetical protein